MSNQRYDAVVVGAGPNGLAAAIRLAQAGRRVLVIEARDEVGGAASSAALTLPGFIHDVGSAVYPLGVASPFFRSLPLERFGLRWIHPPVPVAHPLDGGRAALALRSIRATAAGFGADGPAYARLVTPLVRVWERALPTLLAPLLPPRLSLSSLPALPAMAGFAGLGLLPVSLLARLLFRGEAPRALLAGHAAHSIVPLSWPITGAYALIFAASVHAAGWPIPAGGAGALSRALAAYLRSLGGELRLGSPVSSFEDLPPARAVLFDLSPGQILPIAGERLPAARRRALRAFRHAPGIFKLDWALDGPIPWAAEGCRRAGTVHIGGSLAELVAAEAAPWRGQHSQRPFVLLAQPSLFDPSRAPAGRHTAWAYCHVPRGSRQDMAAAIEEQVERFAPGFRARIIARSAMDTAALERYNANLVGGDITGGVQDLVQLVARPTLSANPYRLAPGLYICSSSTPPGAGVHGMCGYHAAGALLREIG